MQSIFNMASLIIALHGLFMVQVIVYHTKHMIKDLIAFSEISVVFILEKLQSGKIKEHTGIILLITWQSTMYKLLLRHYMKLK